MKVGALVTYFPLLIRAATYKRSGDAPQTTCAQYQIQDDELVETFNQPVITASPISGQTGSGLSLTSFIWCRSEKPPHELLSSDIKCNCEYPENVARFETLQAIPDPGILFMFDPAKRTSPKYELTWTGEDEKIPEIEPGKCKWEFTPGSDFGKFNMTLKFALALAVTKLSYWEISQPDHADFKTDPRRSYRPLSRAWMVRNGDEKGHHDIKALKLRGLIDRHVTEMEGMNRRQRIGMGVGIPAVFILGTFVTFLFTRSKNAAGPTSSNTSTAIVHHPRAGHMNRPEIKISRRGSLSTAPGPSSPAILDSAPGTLNRTDRYGETLQSYEASDGMIPIDDMDHRPPDSQNATARPSISPNKPPSSQRAPGRVPNINPSSPPPPSWMSGTWGPTSGDNSIIGPTSPDGPIQHPKQPQQRRFGPSEREIDRLNGRLPRTSVDARRSMDNHASRAQAPDLRLPGCRRRARTVGAGSEWDGPKANNVVWAFARIVQRQ